MARVILTRELAWAAAMDAGNASMRKAGRKHWNRTDYDAVWKTFDRLWPEERDMQTNSHLKGKAEQTLRRLVRRYGAAKVLGETREIVGKRKHPGRRKRTAKRRVKVRSLTRYRRRVSKRRRRNPTVGILAANPRGLKVAKVISTQVEEVRYRHSQDRHFYKHRFGPGVRLELLTDGSLRFCHPTEKLWDRFA